MTQELSDKTILRRQHDKDNPYFMMARDVAQNTNLSFEALGLLAYLLSKPDDWRVQVADLKREGCARDKAIRILNELKAAGHLRRATEKQPHEKGTGHFDAMEWIVSETPYTEKPSTEKPSTAEPSTAEPSTAEPLPVNPHLHNTDRQKIDSQKTEKEGNAPPQTHMSARVAIAIDDAADQAYQPIDNHTGAMMQADVFIRVFEGACKARNAPQTVPRTRNNRRIAAQWYIDGYSADEIRRAVDMAFEAGKPVAFAFLGEKLSFARNASRPALVKGKFPIRGVPPQTEPARAPSTSEGAPTLKLGRR
jgi:hypothetical protein